MSKSIIRTDLAVESIGDELREGITTSKRGVAFRISEVGIDSDEHGAAIGKTAGRYVTLEWEGSMPTREEAAGELAEELARLLPEGPILVAGLGNDDITPDALGPRTAARVFATRHISKELPDEECFQGLRSVSVIAPGVLAQTGIEAAELLKAAAEAVKPEAVVVIDALACSSFSRLGSTIQACDSGICPGSGVHNSRAELSQRTLGLPVIAVGIPTVLDLRTAAKSAELPELMVTPRDIDKVIYRSAELLGFGLNLALQPTLSAEDVLALTS